MRIVYRICEECRRLGETDVLPLDCCSSGGTPDRTINILCVSQRHYGDIPARFGFDDA